MTKRGYKPCFVTGCELTKYKLSEFCYAHSERLHRYGELFQVVPIGDLPTDRTQRDLYKSQPKIQNKLHCECDTTPEPASGMIVCTTCKRPRFSYSYASALQERARQAQTGNQVTPNQ